jgi:hypothetical protein
MLRSWAAAALLVVSSSCMFEPANETELASTAVAVEFRGVSITPRSTVRIEAAAAPNGPFVQIATAVTDARPMLQGGALTYAFSTTASIPRTRWAQTCAGSETFVRARGGNLVFTTYDSAALAGLDAETCIAQGIADGSPFVSAATTCQSLFGAPARLRVEGGGLSTTTLARGLRIVSHYQAEDYACLAQINGNLEIVDPTSAEIAFPSLTALYPRLLGESRAIDLPLLASVGGNVDVSSVPLPGDQGISALMDFGMPALTQVGGNLAIDFEGEGAGFDSVAGFAALGTLDGDLAVSNRRTTDTSFSNLLASLESVGGDAALRPGLSTLSLLGALETVGGDFSLVAGSLNSIGNLAALVAIAGDASVALGVLGDDLPALETVGGALAVRVDDFGLSPGERYFPLLGDVGGVLRVFESDAPIGVLGAASVDVDGLELEANSSLNDLESDVGHLDIANNGAITIIDNPGISDCEAQDWVDGLQGHNGPVVISGNGPC